MNKFKQQRGDTIIEVLLAMAVLGMVLGTSFGIVNRSLATGRDAQERSEAVKITESQLEKLKTASSDPANRFFDINENSIYCVPDDLTIVPNDATGVIPENTDLPTYPDACKLGPNGRYRISIIRDDNVFTVRTRWNSILGDMQNEVKMVYRTYKYTVSEYPVVRTGTNVITSWNTANLSANLLDPGVSVVTERGFVYNKVPGQHPSSGTKVLSVLNGQFGATITGLDPDTNYYVRAYATNASGTGYGNEVIYRTKPEGL